MYHGDVNHPPRSPICCSAPAKWIIISVRLAYFYCPTCKKEVAMPDSQSRSDEESGQMSLWPSQITEQAQAKKDATNEDLQAAVAALYGADGAGYVPKLSQDIDDSTYNWILNRWRLG